MRLVTLVLLLVVNCTGRQVVTSPGVPDQIDNIIETDVETMPEGPQKQRIKTTLEVAASEIRALRVQVADTEQQRDEAKVETLKNSTDAGKWSGLARLTWFLVGGVVLWLGWRVVKFFKPGLPI